MGVLPVGKLLASMAWPAILSMTINALYNIVDSIFVAMLSEKALTAVSLVLPIQIFMIAMAVGSGVGINSLIARKLGSRSFEDADKAASTSLRIAVFNYSFFAFIGIFLAKPFIGAFTDDPSIYDQGIIYLRIITMFSLFIMVQIIVEKVLQATGNMIAPMLISLLGAIVNLILDPILIFGLLGMPRLEMTGAAVATIIGQFCAMTLGLIILFSKDHAVNIKIKGFKVDWQIVKDIYGVGLPSMIMQSIGSIMVLGYNSILAQSATAVAVLGVYFRLQSFVFMPVFGLNQGAMPIIGYNFGARNRERLMEAYKKALISAVMIMVLGFALFQIFPRQLLLLFSASENMMAIGIPALRIISLCFIPAAFDVMMSAFFQATGHGLYSLFASMIRQLVGILPLAYILLEMGGVIASWYSIPLAEILGLTYSTIMFRKLYRRDILTLE